MFTNPKGLRENGLLYFADVCAGAGGFSEHVLWRKKWRAKGFALTLENEHDFKLEDFYAGPCETFHQYYGPKESGDVFDPDNEEAFTNLIMQHTHGKGVHFVMSDWGFSVEASFVKSFKGRLICHWPNDSSLTINRFAKFIKDKCPAYNTRLEY